MFKKLILIIALALFCSCNNVNPPNTFKLELYNSDYAMAYSSIYKLTEKDLIIVFRGSLEGEKDSIIFSTKLKPTKELRRLSNIDFGGLKDEYKNDCVDDGFQMSVVFTKDSLTKTIDLSNYHQEDIGFAIELINKLVPENNKIYYDKDELLESMKGCN